MATESKRPRSRRHETDADGENSHRRPRLHGDLLASSLLAFLRNWPAYGYQLVR